MDIPCARQWFIGAWPAGVAGSRGARWSERTFRAYRVLSRNHELYPASPCSRNIVLSCSLSSLLARCLRIQPRLWQAAINAVAVAIEISVRRILSRFILLGVRTQSCLRQTTINPVTVAVIVGRQRFHALGFGVQPV